MKKLILLFLLFLYGCAGIQGRLPQAQIQGEEIYGSWFSPPQTLTVVVRSKGCTDENSFKLRSWAHDGKQLLKLQRVKRDPCKKNDHPKILYFPLEELNISRRTHLIILNPYRSRPGFYQQDLDLDEEFSGVLK